MATQRYISTSFWDDAWIQELDPSEKLLYLYLMTNPLTNIAGVYKITVRRIVFDTGFNKDTVERILERFKQDGKAALCGEYVIIPAWPKHQQWEKRKKIQEGIEAVLKNIPDDIKKYMVSIGYEYPLNYSDTDIDTDTDNSAEARADKQLFTAIEDSFLSQLHDDTQYNYGKERKHIKNIIERIHNKDSPEEFIKKVIETFHRLKTGRDKFWSKQPFLPSVLNSGGIWPRVVEEMQNNYVDTGVELWS